MGQTIDEIMQLLQQIERETSGLLALGGSAQDVTRVLLLIRDRSREAIGLLEMNQHLTIIEDDGHAD